MKMLNLGLAGVVAAALISLATPLMSTTVEAHPRGPLCQFQSVDSNGYVRNRVKYCHHLPPQFRQRPQPGFTLYFGSGGFYFGDRSGQRNGRGRDSVCLVTFFDRNQVSGGADADVERAQLLPRQVAERRVRQSDRSRIFEYGSSQKTRETCHYLANLNNASNNGGGGQASVCLVTFFDRSQVSGGADADVERAQLLPRSVAERGVAQNDRNRIFEYGSNQKTSDTCRYLNGINN
jgi:hypothetical protein